jgi:SpoIID/LytB domain protein
MTGRHRMTRRSVRRARVTGLVTALVMAVGIGTWSTGSAPAEAATGDVTITGHGYGHGRGLSQWGAYGYATQHGWNHLNILGHYYSNATLGDVGNPLISVRLTAQDGVATTVYSSQPFLAGGYQIGPGIAAKISRNPDGTWQLTTGFGCSVSSPSSVTITDPAFRLMADPGEDVTRMLSICGSSVRTYRGNLAVAWDGSSLRTVNWLGMQDYLRGVVPRESPASWGDAANGAGMNALMAQAVAARSYSWAENRTSYAKTCDTTACQVYGGAGLNGARTEDRRTDNAVAWTTGQVMMLGGQVARTEFTSSSGGYTAGGTFPVVQDLGDDLSPYHNWSVTVNASTIGPAFGVGTLQAVTVLSRNGYGADGGRVTKVRVRGTTKSVDVSGDAFRSALGLRSDWFSVSAIVGQPYYSNPLAVDLSPTTLSAVRTGAGSVVVFVRGGDNSLWANTAVGGVFGGYTPIPAGALTGPAAVSSDGGRIDLFVVGTDKALWHTWTQVDGAGRPTTWAPFASLGGTLTSAPSAASNGPGNIIVSARDRVGGTSYRILDGGTWGPWRSIDGSGVTTSVAEVYNGSTYRIRMVGTDSDVWTRLIPSSGAAPSQPWVSTERRSTFAPSVSGTTWYARNVRAEAWPNGKGGIRQERDATSLDVDLGGGINSAVAMVELADGTFWTFGRGNDNALWLDVADPSGNSAWVLVGGYIT